MSGIDINEVGFFGRRVLRASDSGELNADTIAHILNDIYPLHVLNAKEITCFHEFVRGFQPVINRTKEVRPEIKNIVIENRAFEVVEFKKSYMFSHAVQYTNASPNDTLPIDLLNTYARLDGKASKDLSLMGWMCTSGNAYRLCLPNVDATEDEAPYYTSTLDPREAFVVYSRDVHHLPLMAGTIVKQKDVKTDKITYDCTVYTKSNKFVWESIPGSDGKLSALTVDFTAVKPKIIPNIYNLIPIVEYCLNDNRMGYVELCYSLFNAINTTDSNRVDALEQFVQSYLVFLGCDLKKDEEGNYILPKAGSALILPPSNSTNNIDVKFITSQLDQDQTQIAKDDLLRSAYEICSVPDRQGRNSGGGDTGQAVSLRNGWGSAEADAKSSEKMFIPSELQYLKTVLAICRKSDNVDLKGMTLGDIEITFSRNHSDNLQTKAQSLQMLIDAGVDGEDAYEVVGLFNDPTAVWNKSKARQEAKVTGNAETANTTNDNVDYGSGEPV